MKVQFLPKTNATPNHCGNSKKKYLEIDMEHLELRISKNQVVCNMVSLQTREMLRTK